MHARRKFQNAWEKNRIAGLNLQGEVKNHKKFLNSIVLLRSPEAYHADTWKHHKLFARSHCRDLYHADKTVLAYLSKYCKDTLVKKDWESPSKTHNVRCLVSGERRGAAREKTMYYWRKFSPRLQNLNSDAYSHYSSIQASRSSRMILGCHQFYGVKVSKPSDKIRGISMPARISDSSFSSTRKGGKTSTTLRKSKVKKSGKGRLHRAGATHQGCRRIEAMTRTPSKASNLIQLSPLVLRRSLIRFKWHLSKERTSGRGLPRGALHLGSSSFYFSAKMENAAIRIQAQWRMYLATNQYRCLRHATLTMQRRWREEKRLSSSIAVVIDSTKKEMDFADCVNSEVDGEINESDELDPGTPYESPCKNSIEKESQRNLKAAGFAVKRLYEDNISAIQEDEIFSEFLSFLPCSEYDSRDSDFVNPSRICSQLQEENGCKNLDPLLNPWLFDMCALDVPASSPAKELAFAKISIDGSLPPTPMKDWTSHKREAGESSPAEPDIKHSSLLDLFELPHSPTKDWASPTCEGEKSNFFVEISPCGGFKEDRLHLPNEWFIDLDVSDTPESCWGTSMVTNVSFTSPSNPNSKSQHGLIGQKMTSSSCRALMCIPEEPDLNVLTFHPIKECAVKTPIIDEPTFQISPKITDPSRWRDKAFSKDDVDSFRWAPSAIAPSKSCGLGSYVSVPPALENELLDELNKLMLGCPDPVMGPSDDSRSLASSCESANDFYMTRSVRSFQTKTVNTANDETFVSSIFSFESARKLDFCLKDEHGPEVLQPATSPSQGAENVLDGKELLEIYEELDDSPASKDSRSYSKRRLSTVTEFLQPVEQKLDNGANGFESSPRRDSKRSLSEVSIIKQQDPGTPQLTAFADEGNFCDKAVDGNVVATKHTPQHQGSDLSSDIFYASSVVWDVAAADDSPKRMSFVQLGEPVVNCLTMDRYLTDFSNHYSSFIKPKVQRSNHPISRSCEAIGISKPTLPSRSRRISFDQIRYDGDTHFTPPEEKGPLLGKRNLCDRLLHTSPVTPDDQCLNVSPHASSSAALCNLDRSSASSVSKKHFLQSPYSKIQGKFGSDTESVTSSRTLHPGKDSLAEVEKGGSGKRARTLFTNQESSTPRVGDDCLNSYSPQYSCFKVNYEDMVDRRGIQHSWGPENLSGPLFLAEESDCNFRKSTGSAWDCGLISDCGMMTDDGLRRLESRGPSLHDLCKVWDEECMDLVTRSLKYKSLMTNPNLLRHEVKLAFEKPEPTSSQSAAWEIENIERLLEKLETRESHKELIKQQRDAIYINIATNASMRDRYRLYSKWGIRRLSRGRLRKVIYDLLWKDPKRYHASADLVLQYL
ncbi:uncharacterized protein [Physcomitrium patens]|uniref:uncharacterized protein isoform X3 n=1 Tax=Physcomitrium patens TaxID=3218 RepID=UPI000D158602|nr:uncharacterized protein LOC112293882 isoform X2 [Physcomitrium patens]|eukprot:XP_024399597.1 uncharacterized protein LOC112293882 isoform X2 [Physcomitrella patens]